MKTLFFIFLSFASLAFAAPNVTLTSPLAGATLSGTVSLQASVSFSGTIKKVYFYRDNWILLGSASQAPYKLNFDTRALVNGSHRFFATAQGGNNSAGASSVISVTVLNSTTPTPTPTPAPTPTPTPTPTPVPVTGVSCAPIAPIAVSGYDALPALQSAKITSGSFVGGYTVAKNDARLIWYFSNIGLLGFVDRIPADVKTYMNLYLANLNPDFSINDIYFNISNGAVNYSSSYSHQTVPGLYADSNDSYAATFLSLALRYYQVTCDNTWLTSIVPRTGLTVLATLKKIADNNLVKSQWPNGLIHVFQSASAYYIAYTEDNAESYRGLADLAILLTSLNDSTAATYQQSASLIATGMQNILFMNNLYSGTKALNQAGFAYYWGDATSFSAPAEPLNSPMVFYPDGATQIFAQAYRMGLPQTSYDAGWKFLNTNFPSYTTSAYDTDPWTVIGWAAALQGNTALAQQMQTKTVNTYTAGTAVPINNWGFYRRISLLLQLGIVY